MTVPGGLDTSDTYTDIETGTGTAGTCRRFELVVLDMAGTTVRDDGLVERAFEWAAAEAGLDRYMPLAEAAQYVRNTMGQSKITVFRHLTGGDEKAAQVANRLFEEAYVDLAERQGVEEIPGATAAIAALNAEGLRIVLTTGFSPATREALLARLGWNVDAALSPADVGGRGRPAPDMILVAVISTQTSDMASVVVVGDTASDIASGRNAGAGLVVGVLTGAHDEALLRAAGADRVIDSVADLPQIVLDRP
jgi:phosphonatase-like hydrolase